MDAVLSLLASPIGQYILALGAGIALKKWPAFYNKWIPLATQVLNFGVAALALVAGAVPAHAGVFDALKPVGNTFLQLLIQSVMMTLMATGTHSALKNTAEGITKK